MEISNVVDSCLAKDAELLKFHNENEYKNYSFSTFYPIEKSKLYKVGKIYTVIIRTVDERIKKCFEKLLENENTESIKALTIETRILPQKYIEKIYSLTPVVVKFENGYWRTNESLDAFEKRLKDNIIKKYNHFTSTKIDENFELFTYMRFDNQKPIATKYKEISLLGDKVTLNVAENDMAQELTYFALGAGVLEMNARGFGFMNYKWI